MKILKDSAALAVLQIGSFIVPLITFPYLTRRLGAEAYGELAIAFGIATYCSIFTDWGFNLSSARRVAQAEGDAHEVSRIFWATLTAKTLLCLFSLACVLALLVASTRFWHMGGVIIATWLLVPATVLQPNWLFQGLEKLTSFAVISLTARLVTVPFILWFVRDPQDAMLAGALQASGSMMAACVALVVVYRLDVIGRPDLTARDVWRELGEGWNLFLSTVAASLYTTTSTVVLGLVSGPVEAGNYAAADRIKSAAISVMSSLSQVIYPRTARLLKEDASAGLRLARQFLFYQTSGAFLLSLTLFIFAPQIMYVGAGAKFTSSADVMRILAWLPFVISFSNVFGLHVLLPLRMDRTFSRVILSGALFSFAAIVPLVWWFGAVGAAGAVLLTEAFVSGAFFVNLVSMNVPLFTWIRNRQDAR